MLLIQGDVRKNMYYHNSNCSSESNFANNATTLINKK